jgi:hypothetical protein
MVRQNVDDVVVLRRRPQGRDDPHSTIGATNGITSVVSHTYGAHQRFPVL